MTRYAVDLDGTLAKTVEATLEIYNERYGTSYTKADVPQWHFWNSMPEIQHLPEPKRRDIILRMMDEAWNTGRVKAYHEANQFMFRLQEYGQVDIVTGRGSGTPDEVIKSWLARNGIVYDKFVRVKGSGTTKVLYGYDVHVDDDPILATEIAARWPDKRVIMPDQPWNRNTPISPRVRRVNNLLEGLPVGAPKQERLFRRAGHDGTDRRDKQVFVRSHGRKVGVYPEGRYYRERKMEPSACQPGSMRTIDIGRKGGHKAVVCRPRDKRTTRTQSILHPRTERERRKLGLPKRVRRSR